MSKTRADLADRALGILGKGAAGQPTAAEDATLLDGMIDPLLAQLRADGIAYVADASAIDDEIFLPLAMLLAEAAAADFGRPDDELWESKSEEARRTLKRIGAGRPTYAPMKADYF